MSELPVRGCLFYDRDIWPEDESKPVPGGVKKFRALTLFSPYCTQVNVKNPFTATLKLLMNEVVFHDFKTG
jgi:hypothetical protein